MWREGCSSPTLELPVYYWEVLSQVQNQGVRAVPQSGTCLPRRTLSRRSLEGRRSSHPSTRSRVSHSNPGWPPDAPERWRQPRGRKWPAARLGRAVPKQGSPGHTRPPASIAHPNSARARCVAVPTRRGASSRVRSARRSPGAQSLQTTHLVVPPERSRPPDP